MKKIACLFHALLMFTLVLALCLSLPVYEVELTQTLDNSSHTPKPNFDSKPLVAGKVLKMYFPTAGTSDCQCEGQISYVSESITGFDDPRGYDNACKLLRDCSRDLARQMEIEGDWPKQTIEQYKRIAQTDYEHYVPSYWYVCRTTLDTVLGAVYDWNRVRRLRTIPFFCTAEAVVRYVVRPDRDIGHRWWMSDPSRDRWLRYEGYERHHGRGEE